MTRIRSATVEAAQIDGPWTWHDIVIAAITVGSLVLGALGVI